MPFDSGDADDDDRKSGQAKGKKRKFDEFECPACSANNPLEFGAGDEISCSYCGLAYIAHVDDEGTLKLREA